MLFESEPRFKGLPEEGFKVFALRDRAARRRAIIRSFHPALGLLGEDLLERLGPSVSRQLHTHLPRLDWPREYEPFCTWLALSFDSHGYQAGAQLNVGVHADHVAVRLGWDASSDAFGRFEFFARHGRLGERLLEIAQAESLRFRVFASAPWPQGSICVFESPDGLREGFAEVQRRGVWWELGHRYDLPESEETVCSARLGREVHRIFAALLPVYVKIAGGEPFS